MLGRDLEISATERLLSGTPPRPAAQGLPGLELRAGGGAKYQLLVFPLQRKVQLVKVTGRRHRVPGDRKGREDACWGSTRPTPCGCARSTSTSGPERGQAHLFAYVGGTLVAEATDEGAGDLTGSASAVSIGATKGANGVIGSVDDVVVRVPSPF